MVFGLHFTSVVAGFVGTVIMALGLAFRPEPVRLPPVLHGIVAGAGRGVAGGVHHCVAFGQIGVGIRARVRGNVRWRTRLHGSVGVGVGVVERGFIEDHRSLRDPCQPT